MNRLLLICAQLVLVASCDLGGGSSQEIEIPVSAPLYSARISEYTGFFPGPWNQDVWIRLDNGVSVSEVVDLNVFAPLKPNMTLEQAVSVTGEPQNTTTDFRGTVWHSWTNDHGVVQVGCVESCSMGSCISLWKLRAFPRGEDARVLFSTTVTEISQLAENRLPDVEYRAVMVDSYDYDEKVTIVLESKWGEDIRWASRGRIRCEWPEAQPGEREQGE